MQRNGRYSRRRKLPSSHTKQQRHQSIHSQPPTCTDTDVYSPPHDLTLSVSWTSAPLSRSSSTVETYPRDDACKRAVSPSCSPYRGNIILPFNSTTVTYRDITSSHYLILVVYVRPTVQQQLCCGGVPSPRGEDQGRPLALRQRHIYRNQNSFRRNISLFKMNRWIYADF